MLPAQHVWPSLAYDALITILSFAVLAISQDVQSWPLQCEALWALELLDGNSLVHGTLSIPTLFALTNADTGEAFYIVAFSHFLQWVNLNAEKASYSFTVSAIMHPVFVEGNQAGMAHCVFFLHSKFVFFNLIYDWVPFPGFDLFVLGTVVVFFFIHSVFYFILGLNGLGFSFLQCCQNIVSACI